MAEAGFSSDVNAEETDKKIDTNNEADSSKPAVKSNKVDILLKATADAPVMAKRKWTVDRDKKLIWVIEFVRQYLKLDTSESLFIYINQTFSPAPDVSIGTLFDCFSADRKLILHYCKSQAWG